MKGVSVDSDGNKFWNNIIGCGDNINNNNSNNRYDDTLTATETESMISSLSIKSDGDRINHNNHLKDDGSSTLTTNTTATSSHSISSSTQYQHNDDVDDGIFTFKFNHHNKTYRFRSSVNDFDMLYKMIKNKLENIFSNEVEKEKTTINIYYMDEDQDKVVMNTNSDVMESIKVARCMGLDRVKLFIILDDSLLYYNKNNKKLNNDTRVTNNNNNGNDNNNNNKNNNKKKTTLPNSQGMNHWPMAVTFFGVIIIGVFSFSKIYSRL